MVFKYKLVSKFMIIHIVFLVIINLLYNLFVKFNSMTIGVWNKLVDM